MDTTTIATWLADATARLTGVGVATARLDCLVLLEDVTGKERSWLLAHPEDELESYQIKELKSMLRRRVAHEPLAYIRGKSEFYGREFVVNSHTLEPRPETETMIELLLNLVESRKLKVESLVDVGTGSGCIAITTALELPGTKVYATDIDEECLKTARQNAQSLGADVTFLQGNLLRPIPTSFLQRPSSILANLPYVPETHQINQAALHEPRRAIFGGKDGLDYYRMLFVQIDEVSNKPVVILAESLPSQHATLTEIATRHGYKLTESRDFIQCFEKS